MRVADEFRHVVTNLALVKTVVPKFAWRFSVSAFPASCTEQLLYVPSPSPRAIFPAADDHAGLLLFIFEIGFMHECPLRKMLLGRIEEPSNTRRRCICRAIRSASCIAARYMHSILEMSRKLFSRRG